ncbi:thiamine diphosphokinase [Alkalicoccus daliensis]|uniref:Thiamine diphosphokinase n=1 Tax=Alkalicoccus daliensis TaxID=745820 RepID=A0A1G9ZYS7_9BACI|nr:thiamine diphosphokinase [Alkalicoccus daliensis]SDN26490.1 thiamine pyrophosphokinase [Alkalicoccus daliensis]
MKFVLMAGGPEFLIPPLDHIEKDYQGPFSWIGIDRGAYALADKNIGMTAAVGDFDSVTANEFQQIQGNAAQIIKHPAVKNATDLELSVEFAVNNGASEIILLGATGGRLDHAQLTIQLMQICEIPLYIVDKFNRVRLLQPGKHVLTRSAFKYVSFLPAGVQIKELTLQGFKYEIEKMHIQKGSSLCVSNEWDKTEAVVELKGGDALFIESRDNI